MTAEARRMSPAAIESGVGQHTQAGMTGTLKLETEHRPGCAMTGDRGVSVFPPLPPSFFARPAEIVAPELIGCRLVQRQADGALLWGVIVETEAYCQSEPACHGHRRRSPSNDTLFGAPGQFYVYVSYGIHHCVNVVTGASGWANGVLLRAASLPGEPERIAAGPGLLARRFGLDRRHDRLPADPASGLWLAPRCDTLTPLLEGGGAPSALMQTGRIGIRQGQDLPWRWYLRASRSVSRRAPGDRPPRRHEAWTPGAVYRALESPGVP